MNIEDVFGFNLKPKEDFGVPVPEKDSRSSAGIGDFVCGTDEEYFTSDYYLTREEAVAQYPADAGLEPGEGFNVGRAVRFKPEIDTDSLLERLAEEAADEVGEHSDNWLENIKTEHYDELKRDLNNVLNSWLTRYGHQPGFYKVEDVTDHTVPEIPMVNTFQGILRNFGRRDNE